jgi:hypothetical protein
MYETSRSLALIVTLSHKVSSCAGGRDESSLQVVVWVEERVFVLRQNREHHRRLHVKIPIPRQSIVSEWKTG